MTIGSKHAKNITGIMKKYEMSMSSDCGKTSVQIFVLSTASCSLNHKRTGMKRTVPKIHVTADRTEASFGDILDRYGGTTMQRCLSMLIRASVQSRTTPDTNCNRKNNQF